MRVWSAFLSLTSFLCGTLTKINLYSVLKGIRIYKSSERILPWDLGDGEWSCLSHRHAGLFLAKGRTCRVLSFLIEKVTAVNMVHNYRLGIIYNNHFLWNCYIYIWQLEILYIYMHIHICVFGIGNLYCK